MLTHITIKWETQAAGGGLVHVNERMQGEKGFTQWGPMCPEIVQSFIDERKAYHMRLRDETIRILRERNPLAALAQMERAY